MYEIELKAHVYNREKVISKLNEIAIYGGHTEKSDTYYHLPKKDDYLSVRIRKESLLLNNEQTFTNYFTYKRKESFVSENGSMIEVNQENEFTMADSKPLELLFKDLGGTVSLVKNKSADQWSVMINGNNVHIELCNVPPLGDFLEIEILKEKNDDITVIEMKKIEENIFLECGIQLSQIENRYYSELLREINK
ncbi:MAG: CYTH domain-containing protein [Treponema sp.]|nr:CYTH domain-containing protein [Treponema sp.]